MMPPPPLSRFPNGPNAISPYHQQFPTHAQHSANHPGPGPLGGNPAAAYLNPNAAAQLNNPFGANSNLLGLGGNLNTAAAAAGFSLGGDATGMGSHAARMGFAHAASLQQQQQAAAQHSAQQAAQHSAQQAQAQQHSQHNQQQLQVAQHLHTAQQQHQQQHAQQQQQSHSVMGGGDQGPRDRQQKGRIREVWKHNLHEEMANLRDLVDRYPYIAMDTEFPGVVSRPMGGFRGKSDYHYQCLRTNVDMLKVIQIGLALFNEDGEQPPARPNSTDSADLAVRRQNGNAQGQGPFPYAWQFNFKFSLKDDMFNQTSIESLQAAGIDFNLLERDGIDPHEFASLLIPSGLVCFENVKWISFHGGYDFGYLTKLLICRHLPNDEIEFDQIMKLYFPSTYDVKHLMKHAIKLHQSGMLTPSDAGVAEILQKFEQKSGLEHISETLKVKRVGSAHQAGSDSLLTGRVFFELRKRIFNGEISEDHIGKVWGLGIPDFSLVGMTIGQATAAGNNTNGQNGVESTPPPSNNNNNNNNNNSQNGNQNGTPSTPNTHSVGLASTPGAGPSSSHNTNGGMLGGMGPMTPGGGGGVFGAFAFGGNR